MKIEDRLDQKGGRISDRLDERVYWARGNGKDRLADRLDKKGGKG